MREFGEARKVVNVMRGASELTFFFPSEWKSFATGAHEYPIMCKLGCYGIRPWTFRA